MAFQAVPNTAEIVIQYFGNDVTMHNVLHAEKAGGYTLADLQLLAAAVDFGIFSHWLPLQTLDYTYISTTVRGLALPNDQETTNTTNSGPGGDLSNALPGNVTFAIKKSSGLTGRNARGRVYWMGLPSNQLKANENVLIATDAVNIEIAVEALRQDIASTIWSPVIVSRFLNNVKRPTGVTFPWVDTIRVDDNVDSMRPRLI